MKFWLLRQKCLQFSEVIKGINMSYIRNLTVAVFAFGSSWAFAAPPTVASIEALLVANNTKQALDTANAGIMTRMQQEMVRSVIAENRGAPPTAQQRQAMDKVSPEVGKILREELSFEKVKPEYIVLYQQQYTQEEVDKLLALSKDPVYAALMRKAQAVNERSAQIMAGKLPVILKKIEPVLEKSLKEVLGEK